MDAGDHFRKQVFSIYYKNFTAVGNWTMRYLFLIWLTFISDFLLSLHHQTNMYAARVSSPHI